MSKMIRHEYIRHLYRCFPHCTPGVSYVGTNKNTNNSRYQIYLPIWQIPYIFEVSPAFEITQCIPAHMGPVIDYVNDASMALQRARDYRPINEDLTPLSLEEVNIFGVRENQPNACIPRKSHQKSHQKPYTKR